MCVVKAMCVCENVYVNVYVCDCVCIDMCMCENVCVCVCVTVCAHIIGSERSNVNFNTK